MANALGKIQEDGHSLKFSVQKDQNREYQEVRFEIEVANSFSYPDQFILAAIDPSDKKVQALAQKFFTFLKNPSFYSFFKEIFEEQTRTFKMSATEAVSSLVESEKTVALRKEIAKIHSAMQNCGWGQVECDHGIVFYGTPGTFFDVAYHDEQIRSLRAELEAETAKLCPEKNTSYLPIDQFETLIGQFANLNSNNENSNGS